MKSINGLFYTIISIDNLRKAWEEVRKVKQKDSEIVSYSFGITINLYLLHQELAKGTWKPQAKDKFVKHEKKTREITPITIEGKIVAQAIYQVLSPIMNRKFSKNSYACIKGRGQHMCAQNVQRTFFNYHHKFSVFKGDIKGYFKHVNKKRLRKVIVDKIRDRLLVKLLFKFISAFTESGIPIGWLTSELFANMYLDYLDQYIRKYYPDLDFFRFMDDFVISTTNLKRLKACVRDIENNVFKNLKLIENPKSKIYTNHVDFCGYVIYGGYKKPRIRILNSAFRRFKKYIMYGEFRKLFDALPSLFGYAKFCMCRTSLVSRIYKLFSPLYIINHKTQEEYYTKFLAILGIKDQLIHEKGAKYNGEVRTNKGFRTKAA